MMGWYGDDPGWAGWIVMAMMMLGFWALVVVAVIALFRGVRPAEAPRGDARESATDEANRILDARFARGEIDVEEYRQRRDALAPGARR